MWFQIRQFLARARDYVHNIPFNIQLRLLNLRYGRGNIPPDKLPQIITGGPEEERVFHRVIMGSTYLNAILAHYKVSISDSVAAGAFGRYLRAQSLDEDEVELIRGILSDEHPALRMYELVQRCGDIPETKLTFFGPPAPFESMEAWLLSIER